METTTTQSADVGQRGIATPIKVVLVGGLLSLLEGTYDVLNANLYAGVFDGVEVTTTEIIVVTAIAMAVAVAMLAYAYRVRAAPTKRAYLVLGVLALVTLVVGVLFTAVVALLGAVIGYWETRRAPVE